MSTAISWLSVPETLCIAPGSFNGASYCGDQTCNGAAGCPLTAHFGSATATVQADAAAVTKVALDGTITAVDGYFSVTFNNPLGGTTTCNFSIVVPSGTGMPVSVSFDVQPEGDTGSLVQLANAAATTDVSGLTLSSGDPTCDSLASLILQGLSLSNQLDPLLSSMAQSRASAIVCAECDASCSASLACVPR